MGCLAPASTSSGSTPRTARATTGGAWWTTSEPGPPAPAGVVAVLQDLAGPKIRIGPLADPAGIPLETGGRLRIAVGNFAGDAGRVSTSCAPLAAALDGGETLLLDDGRIVLRVIESDGAEILAEVEHGGLLSPRKGINAPGVEIPMSAVTAADEGEIEAAVSMGVDFVGVSFVQSGDDLRRARELACGCGGDKIGLVAKIERPQALDRINDILAAADAVLVARGDLGLEIPLEHVPRVQKDLTRRARDAGVPVIVATQVLDTMRHAPAADPGGSKRRGERRRRRRRRHHARRGDGGRRAPGAGDADAGTRYCGTPSRGGRTASCPATSATATTARSATRR